MRCKVCKAYIPEGATSCFECGDVLGTELICQKCGAEIKRGAAFCYKCRHPVYEPPPIKVPEIPEDVSNSVACPKCGEIIPANIIYCPACGINRQNYMEEKSEPVSVDQPLSDSTTDIVGNERVCPRCGTSRRGSGRFCHNCGRFLGTDIADTICPICGSRSPLRYIRCQYCGNEIPK